MKFLADSPEAIAEAARRLGFLPFFRNGIPGFSIEEHTPPELWFSGENDGPWEWKGPAIEAGGVIYGKFFGGKAGYVSLEWFPDLANYRRDGYDFDTRYECGMAGIKDNNVYDTVSRYGSLLTGKLKSICGYGRGGAKGFDSVIGRLMMQTYICISGFDYMVDKHGNTYGWGVARYSTPENLFGYELITSAYSREPLESKARIIDHIRSLFPDADEKQILKIIR